MISEYSGVFIGYKYIRGCLDRVLRNGFNETALRTHRFHQVYQLNALFYHMPFSCYTHRF